MKSKMHLKDVGTSVKVETYLNVRSRFLRTNTGKAQVGVGKKGVLLSERRKALREKDDWSAVSRLAIVARRMAAVGMFKEAGKTVVLSQRITDMMPLSEFDVRETAQKNVRNAADYVTSKLDVQMTALLLSAAGVNDSRMVKEMLKFMGKNAVQINIIMQ